MANINVNNRKNAIEITKSFEKKARVFNSPEYNELKAAKADFPTYRVVVKSSSKRKIENRIKMKDIVYYVEKHGSDEEKQTLKDLRSKSAEEAKKANAEGYIFEMEESASFADIKHWFFQTYPEIANKTQNRNDHIAEILAETDKKAAAKAAAKAEAADEAAVA